MSFLKQYKELPKTFYLVAGITLLTRIGYFMSLPFLAIYLVRENIFTHGQIGLILGIGGFLYSLTSLANGVLIEGYSKKIALSISLVLSGLCYLGISFSSHYFWGLFLLNATLGWFRSSADLSATTTMVQDSTESTLKHAYNLRFIAMNSGAMIGPLIGALLANQKTLFIFIIAGVIHIILGIFMIFSSVDKTQSSAPKTSAFLTNLGVLLKDRTLLNMTFINVIIWILYSQLDTTIPQFLTQLTAHPAHILSIMMIINALMCVTFSSYALQIRENYSIKIVGCFGSICLMIGFLMMGIFPHPASFIIAIVIISIGELFTLLANSFVVSSIAPKHLIASYNGLFNFSAIGLSIGPIIGGYGLQFLGGQCTLLLLALLLLLCLWRYLSINPNLPQPLQ